MASEPSIRERVRMAGAILRGENPSPEDVRQAEIELVGCLPVIMDERRKRQMAYNRVLADLRSQRKSSAEARIDSEITAEYESLLEADDAHEATLEMIRGCRSFLRSLAEEMRLQR